MTYVEFVRRQLAFCPVGEPIYTTIIAAKLATEFGLPKEKAAAATSVAFNRIMAAAVFPNLRRYQKGIYYFTAATPFGEVGINKECLVANKYLLPDNGYETGLTALHHIGLTSQLPRNRCIVSNKAHGSTRLDSELNVFVYPPKTAVNKQNKAYLQFLDLLNAMDKAPVDAENPFHLLAEYIKQQELKYEQLLYLADKYYSRKTILQLAHTASEGGISNGADSMQVK